MLSLTCGMQGREELSNFIYKKVLPKYGNVAHFELILYVQQHFVVSTSSNQVLHLVNNLIRDRQWEELSNYIYKKAIHINYFMLKGIQLLYSSKVFKHNSIIKTNICFVQTFLSNRFKKYPLKLQHIMWRFIRLFTIILITWLIKSSN